MARKYKLGDMWSADFDYDGMVEYGRTIDIGTSEKTIQKYADSLEDVNYHTLAKPLFDLEVAMSGDKEKIKRHFLVNFRRTLSNQLVEFGDKPLSTDEIYFFAKGGMTEKDKLDEAIKHFEDKIKKQGRITNARDEEQLSRLKELRKSFAEGGMAEGYSKFKVLYIPYSGKTQEKMFDFYSEAYKYYDELVDDERGGGTTTIILQGYTDEYNEFEDIFYFDPMEMKEQDDDFAKGGEILSKEVFRWVEVYKRNNQEYYDNLNEEVEFEEEKIDLNNANDLPEVFFLEIREKLEEDGHSEEEIDNAIEEYLNKYYDEDEMFINKSYAKGGEMDNNTFVNVLKDNGFKEQRTKAKGVRLFYNDKNDMYASVDDKNRLVQVFEDNDIVGDDGTTPYSGYSVRELSEYLTKNKYMQGGETATVSIIYNDIPENHRIVGFSHNGEEVIIDELVMTDRQRAEYSAKEGYIKGMDRDKFWKKYQRVDFQTAD